MGHVILIPEGSSALQGSKERSVIGGDLSLLRARAIHVILRDAYSLPSADATVEAEVEKRHPFPSPSSLSGFLSVMQDRAVYSQTTNDINSPYQHARHVMTRKTGWSCLNKPRLKVDLSRQSWLSDASPSTICTRRNSYIISFFIDVCHLRLNQIGILKND